MPPEHPVAQKRMEGEGKGMERNGLEAKKRKRNAVKCDKMIWKEIKKKLEMNRNEMWPQIESDVYGE
eukprot:scaffold162785_cov33-Prasinocladus_malaysianus.AAC.1